MLGRRGLAALTRAEEGRHALVFGPECTGLDDAADVPVDALERPPPPAARAAFEGWWSGVEARIAASGWLPDPTLRPKALATLLGAFLRAGFTEGELRTLHGFVRAIGRDL